jgi:hypothetical protein
LIKSLIKKNIPDLAQCEKKTGLEDLGQDKYWYYSQSAKFNPFWKNVINVWASVKDDPSTAPEEILSQPIWHNGRIRVGGQPVFFSHWAKSGIFFFIKDKTSVNSTFHGA